MSDPIYSIKYSAQNKHKRIYRRSSFILAIFLLVILILVVLFLINLGHISSNGSSKSVIGNAYIQKFAEPQTFTSEYFQFTDNEKWVYAPNDSTSNKITYLLYQSGVLAHSLTVYVNQTPLQDDLVVTRVLPVQITGGNSFIIGSISQTCGSTYAANIGKVIKNVVLENSSFLCVPDSPEYTVIVGQVGANYNLSLKRADGETANYIIIYHNLSVNPNPMPFLSIMRTFKAI
jgi:hypothetical protein